MPNCFTLTPKGATEPEALNAIDERICTHLGIPVHPKEWAYGWYHCIGFQIATGKALDSQALTDYVTANIPDPSVMLRILAFLRENYTDNAWVEIGKR